jgi:hypothetical protein
MKHLLIVLLLVGCSKKTDPGYEVPYRFCTKSYTGKTYDEVVTTNMCAAFNKDGICTVSVPMTNVYTRHETSVSCAFTTWE